MASEPNDPNAGDQKPKYDREAAEKQVEETLAKLNDSNLSDDEKTELSQKALNDYSAALRSEFEVQVAENAEDTPQFTKQFFREHLGLAAAGIVHLASNSLSDSVRMAACKQIITYALDDAEAEGDPIKKLMEELHKNNKPAPTPNPAPVEEQ